MSFAADASRRPNRLVQEQSPYLLQHAYNPVDWYPWGEEAFAKARAEEKPIFLSIGYSTCHWCHVMERESFENEAIARMLNEQFVAIKVDREERPDLDQVYMAAVTALSGSGGWPMTVFLTPEGKPFYGGTYFPPERRWGRPGLPEVLAGVATAWRQAERRQQLLASAEQLTQYLRQAQTEGASEGSAAPAADVLDAAYRQFAASYDDVWGGFGGAPKFPRPHTLLFLLRYWHRSGETQALAMVEQALQKMAQGGMCDQVGGGFHRYSVDRQWLVPHFEKMLYDQALLARAYLETYQATGRADYAEVARSIFDYVLRDLTDSRGGFYSAEDADSEGEEGKFYVWTPEEIRELLGEEEAEFVGAFYGVRPGGNFSTTEHGGPAPPKIVGGSGGEHSWSILHIEQPLEAFAELRHLEPVASAQRLASARARLLEARSRRIRPHRDDKILTDWNGLMISSLAFGGAVLDEPLYRDAAVAAAEFILGTMQRDGRLLHRYRNGDAAVDGFLDDYACLVQGLLDLYEATGEVCWLQEAVRLADRMLEEFWDEARGGFLFRSRRLEPLVVAGRELYDGAVPSGNSVAALDLVRLATLTGQQRFEERAEAIWRAFGDQIGQAPMAYPYFLCALDLALGPSQELVLAGDPGDEVVWAMRRAVFRRFLPRRVLLLRPPDGAGAEALATLASFTASQPPLQGRATAYVCQNFTCQQPVTDLPAFEALLDRR